MDLIYTDKNRADLGVIHAYAIDLSFGASENDYEITIGRSEAVLDYGSVLYIEGTEYGGVVDAKKTITTDENITYMGRTWHGVLNSKVIEPDSGESYLVVSGDANEILSTLISRLTLGDLFTASAEASGINISGYQFHRYCKGYDGIMDMLSDNGAKLKIAWKNRGVVLSAVPIADYTALPVDNDEASLTVERHEKKVNHLVCLGKGELAEREVIHLYSDENGNIGDTQHFFGIDEFAEPYDNSNAEDLRSESIKKFRELLNIDKAELDLNESQNRVYDIGDLVGATDINSGVSVAAAVTQKIVKISNGEVSVDYKTGSGK